MLKDARVRIGSPGLKVKARPEKSDRTNSFRIASLHDQVRVTWVQVLSLPAESKGFNLLEPQFPHLKNL